MTIYDNCLHTAMFEQYIVQIKGVSNFRFQFSCRLIFPDTALTDFETDQIEFEYKGDRLLIREHLQDNSRLHSPNVRSFGVSKIENNQVLLPIKLYSKLMRGFTRSGELMIEKIEADPGKPAEITLVKYPS